MSFTTAATLQRGSGCVTVSGNWCAIRPQTADNYTQINTIE